MHYPQRIGETFRNGVRVNSNVAGVHMYPKEKMFPVRTGCRQRIQSDSTIRLHASWVQLQVSLGVPTQWTGSWSHHHAPHPDLREIGGTSKSLLRDC